MRASLTLIASTALLASTSLLASTASFAQGPDPSTNPADAKFIGAMKDLMVSMHGSLPTGETDKDFVRLLLVQKKSAVELAKTELQYGKDPDIKAIAQSVESEGEKQIAAMQAWQDKHK